MDEGILEDFIATTVEQLVAVYYVKYSKENHGFQTQRNFLYTVKSGIIPVMGKKLITEILRRDAIALIQDVAARAPGRSGNVLKAGRQIFEYGSAWGWLVVCSPLWGYGQSLYCVTFMASIVRLRLSTLMQR